MSNKVKVIISDDQKAVKIPTGIRLLIRRCCNAVKAAPEFAEPFCESEIFLIIQQDILSTLYEASHSLTGYSERLTYFGEGKVLAVILLHNAALMLCKQVAIAIEQHYEFKFLCHMETPVAGVI